MNAIIKRNGKQIKSFNCLKDAQIYINNLKQRAKYKGATIYAINGKGFGMYLYNHNFMFTLKQCSL